MSFNIDFAILSLKRLGVNMKAWFTKWENIKMLISLIPIIVTMYLVICSELSTDRLVILLIVSLLAIATLNFEDIAKMSIGKDGIALEKRKLEELKQEAQVTLDKLNETIEPLLKFNLALIVKDGSFDNVTDFDELSDFIYALDELSGGKFKSDPQLAELFNLSLHNIVYSFSYKADTLLKKRAETRHFVQFGGEWRGQNIMDIPIIVQIIKLRSLSDDSEYQALLDRFVTFANRYLPESLVDN